MSDMSDLFARDPLSLTKEDRSKMIAHYREQRDKFLEAGSKAPKKEKTPVPAGGLNLTDLGL